MVCVTTSVSQPTRVWLKGRAYPFEYHAASAWEQQGNQMR